jgi:hypothetical protein
MIRFCRGLAAVVFVLASGAVPASAATVSVRVEGAQRTLVGATKVQPSSGVTVDKTSQGGTTCAGTSGGGALELATGGNWGGRSDAQGQRVERIVDETYLLGAEFSGRFWSLYVNNVPASSGLCAITPQEGDEILLAAACGGATTDCFSGDPLDLRAPAKTAPGEAVTVSVDEYTSDFSGPSPTASKASSAGATVAGGGQSASTDAQGHATFTFTDRGPVELVTTKGGRIRDEATVCVTDGNDGFCGTAKPGEAASAPAPCTDTNGHDGRCGTRDATAPAAAVGAVREGQTFAAGRGPRTLAGKVTADPSGLLFVKLRLTRTDRGRCSYFSGKSERFRPARCGAANGKWFVIGDRADWSYLLPTNLPRGRYVLDVNAVDKAYNRDDVRERGVNRVVFSVR